jgi:transposase
VPIDNNQGRTRSGHGRLAARTGYLRDRYASARAAAIMSLIQSARMNGPDPYAYLKDLLTRLPTQKASEIGNCRIIMPA